MPDPTDRSFVDLPSLGYRIDRLFAYLTTGADGEGVAAVTIDRTLMPLIGADADRVMALRPYAEEIARRSGRPVRLVRFDTRTEIEVLEPTSNPDQPDPM